MVDGRSTGIYQVFTADSMFPVSEDKSMPVESGQWWLMLLVVRLLSLKKFTQLLLQRAIGVHGSIELWLTLAPYNRKGTQGCFYFPSTLAFQRPFLYVLKLILTDWCNDKPFAMFSLSWSLELHVLLVSFWEKKIGLYNLYQEKCLRM